MFEHGVGSTSLADVQEAGVGASQVYHWGISGARPTLVVWLQPFWPRFKAAPCLRSCAATHLTLKRRWTRSLIESRTLGPGELNSASRGVPSSRRPPGRHSA